MTDERKEIEKIIEELKGLVKGDDKAAIEAKSQALSEHVGKLAQRAAAKQQGGGEAGGGEAGGGAGGSAGGQSAGGKTTGGKEDVVDAEFEEVKDEDKKKNQ